MCVGKIVVVSTWRNMIFPERQELRPGHECWADSRVGLWQPVKPSGPSYHILALETGLWVNIKRIMSLWAQSTFLLVFLAEERTLNKEFSSLTPQGSLGWAGMWARRGGSERAGLTLTISFHADKSHGQHLPCWKPSKATSIQCYCTVLHPQGRASQFQLLQHG